MNTHTYRQDSLCRWRENHLVCIRSHLQDNERGHQMFPRYFSSHIAFVLLIFAIWACGSSSSNTADTDKANKLVDEGNAAVEQFRKLVGDAEAKKDEMMRTDVRRMADARARAAEAIAAYDQAAAKCKEAASKFDEASRLNVGDKFKQYLILKA